MVDRGLHLPAGHDTSWTSIVVIVLVGVLAGAAGGLVTHVLEPRATTPAGTVSPTRVPAEPGGKELSIAQIVAKVEPTVVTIRTKDAKGYSFGTGIVVGSDGEVLTNAHVVDHAQSIFVSLAGQGAFRYAVLLSSDTTADLALLHIDGARDLVSAQLGSSAAMRVGDTVIAIGDALDLWGGFTVTHGIVSGLNRNNDGLTGLIQTDAGISSGMSGGPLINGAGQIIGINSRIGQPSPTSAVEDIGFAIPSDRAEAALLRLRRVPRK